MYHERVVEMTPKQKFHSNPKDKPKTMHPGKKFHIQVIGFFFHTQS